MKKIYRKKFKGHFVCYLYYLIPDKERNIEKFINDEKKFYKKILA